MSVLRRVPGEIYAPDSTYVIDRIACTRFLQKIRTQGGGSLFMYVVYICIYIQVILYIGRLVPREVVPRVIVT